MILERLELSNFRSYKKNTFNLGRRTVLVAPNGAGKTNLLEAIYLLATGNSPRAGRTEEMIAWGADIGSVTGIVNQGNEQYSNLTVVLTPGVYLGKRTTKRRYLVDGAARARARFLGRVVAVLFRPEDLRLVEGSPGRRRQYLDDILSQADSDYARSLTLYESALRRRNKILDAIREGNARREQLAFWDATMIKNGGLVTDRRREFLEYMSEKKTSFGEYKLVYDASTISEARLAKYADAEVAVGHTLVGPHKDDFTIVQQIAKNGQDSQDLMKYGSRGEQRLGVLFLKLAGMEYIESKLKVKPILLLDDIFSELDVDHRQEVVKMMDERQTILTTAEEESLQYLGEVQVVRL